MVSLADVKLETNEPAEGGRYPIAAQMAELRPRSESFSVPKGGAPAKPSLHQVSFRQGNEMFTTPVVRHWHRRLLTIDMGESLASLQAACHFPDVRFLPTVVQWNLRGMDEVGSLVQATFRDFTDSPAALRI